MVHVRWEVSFKVGSISILSKGPSYRDKSGVFFMWVYYFSSKTVKDIVYYESRGDEVFVPRYFNSPVLSLSFLSRV